jgi:outer membrane receptor for ferrienterochelin and colicin
MIRLSLAAPVLALAAALTARSAAAQDTLRVVPLDTVAVEVLRSPLPALHAPFAVSRVDEGEIRPGRAALTLADALRAVPGVQV